MKNVIITILIVLVLGLSGYLVYDKVLSKETNENTNEQQITDNDENSGNKFSLKTSSITQVATAANYEAIVYNGQAYLKYNGAGTNVVTFNYGSYYIEGLKTPDSDNTDSYKLESLNNVVSVYHIAQGNGEDVGICNGDCFAFILDTGKMAVLNVSAIQFTNQVSISTIEGLENVVSVVQARTPGAYNAYAIDVKGNLIDLAKYFK